MSGIINNRDFTSEFTFAASRSSGPGGQNVNKVNSRVELRFSVTQSALLYDDEKEIVLRKLKNRINAEGELLIAVQTDRSQLKNKEEAVSKFYELIAKALAPRKPRKATRPTFASVTKRLESKKQVGEKKLLRRRPE